MAANIYNPEDYCKITQRIQKLNETSKRRWGKMNITQMLEHCARQLELALGKIPQEQLEGPAILRTGLARWISLYGGPWPKGFYTPQKMNMVKGDYPVEGFAKEKKKLLVLLEEVVEKTSLQPHPFFGAMNQKDWGRMIWKHIDHHLKQFG